MEGGVLLEVGPTRRVENLALARRAVEVSAVGRVVMPGFIDCHTHLLFPPPGPFLSEPEAAARAIRTLTAQRLESQARTHLEAMARHGTTTVEIKTGCGPDLSAELKILRALAALRQQPVSIVPSFLLRPGASKLWPGDQWDALESQASSDFLHKIRGRNLARFADVCVEDSLPSDSLGRYFDSARHLGLGSKVHAEGGSASAGVALAVQHGAISVDHLEHAMPHDVARIGASDTIATLLPCASFHNNSVYAPARALIDAGATVALGSNFNTHHTPTLNMQTVIKLACCRMAMSPAEAISAATINAAHVLGCAGTVGSLEPGKAADLLILNISDYRELAHHFGTNLVHRTIKRGQIIWEDGEVAPRPTSDLRQS